MKRSAHPYLALGLGGFAAVACLYVGLANAQDVSLKPTYGKVDLKAGFTPDPFKKKVEAGGPLETNKGGVTTWITNAPDFRLNYTAGEFPLTFYVESAKDTTLLVNLPDGKLLAKDDGPNTGLNPLIKIQRPQSGQYDIWVGILDKNDGTPPAVLQITELK